MNSKRRTFSIDHKKFVRFRFWQNIYMFFYLVLIFGLNLFVALMWIKGINLEETPFWMQLLIVGLTIGIPLLLFLLIRQLITYNIFLDRSKDRFKNAVIEIDEETLKIRNGNTEIQKSINDLKVQNFCFAENSKNLFYQSGFIRIIDKAGQEFNISSVVFHHSVGCATVHDIFGKGSQYSRHKLKWKQFKIDFPC